MKRKSMSRATALLLVFVIICTGIFAVPTDTQAAVKATKITLSATKQSLGVGGSFTLKVKAVTPDNADKAVTYKSSDTKVAAVNSKGKVTAKQIGKATITVTSKSNKKVTAKCTVTVKEGVQSIQTASALTLQKGKSVKLNYSITPNTVSNKKVKFSSNKKSVATVNSKGKVKAKKAGKATITVQSADGCAAATVKVTVKKKVTAVKSVSLNKTSLNLTPGSSEKLTASILPKKATSTKLYWVSQDTGVASVDKNGKVTAVGSGKTTVTAYASDHSGKKASCTVAVAESETGGSASVTLNSEDIEISGIGVYTVKLSLAEGTWTVENGADVSSWFADKNQNSAFINTVKAATAAVSGNTMTISLDASKIAGFSGSGVVDLYVKVPTNAVSTGKDIAPLKVGTYKIPSLEIDSQILGSMFNTQTVDFGDTKATLTLSLDGLDNSKIDSSKASVSLDKGDGYYEEEFNFKGTSLTGSWTGGKTSYALTSDDLTYVNSADGAGWTTLGGDGQGLFAFNLKVSGITYNGLPVESKTFRFQVYDYGRDFYWDALGLYGEEPEKIAAAKKPLGKEVTAGSEPVWEWVGEDGVDSEIPILCDQEADNFYVVWPADTDASKLTAKDVTITLKSQYGDEKELKPEEDYVVYYDNGTTQINVIYQNLPFIPVYNKMDIRIDNGSLTADKEYEIASVYVYYTMFGGPTGVRRGWLFYGFDMDTFTDSEQLLRSVFYTLKYTEEDGSVKYYSEEKGLVDLESEATLYNGKDALDIKLQGNYLSYQTTSSPNFQKTEEKTIDGKTYEFEVMFDTNSINGMLYNPVTLLTERPDDKINPIEKYPIPKPASGYAIAWKDTGWVTMEKWGWMNGVNLGWRTINIQSESQTIKYTNKTPSITLVKGTEEQFFTPDLEGIEVTWSISTSIDLYTDTTGDEITGTTISKDGLLTIPIDEEVSNITLFAKTDKEFSIGAINIKLVDPE